MAAPTKEKLAGMFFFHSLGHALTYGVAHYGEDTERRTKFINENEHLYAGTMLVALFAYLESTLGRTWIARCGGVKKHELEMLRIVRNAFIHTNSHIKDLDSCSENEEKDLREYVAKLHSGKIRDEKGNVYPAYMEISDEGIVSLKQSAIHIFKVYGAKFSH